MKWKTSIKETFLILMACLMIGACSRNASDKAAMPNEPNAESPDQSATADAHQILNSPSLDEISSSLIPEGWEMLDTVLNFEPENLYEHINGSAELYLAYDFVKLTFAGYVNSSNSNEFIDVFIYDMGSSTNAFGIFSVERSEGEPPVKLGRIAYRSSGSYFVWKGQYYLQVIASDDTEKLRKIGLDMATKASQALNDTHEPVWGLSAFPKEHLVPESIKFFLVDAMGLDFMSNTYTADYQKNGSRTKMFIAQQTSSTSAGRIISQYEQYVQKYGNGTEHLTIDGIHLMACDMGGRYDIVSQKGQLVCGVLSAKDRSAALKAAADFWNQIHPDS